MALALSAGLDEDFEATSLPSGFGEGPVWNAGGLVSFPGGSVIVDGSKIYSTATFGPGTVLQFEAKYTAANFQNIGFASDGEFGSPWIVIGRGNQGDNNLYARNSEGASVDLGSGFLDSPHIYKIEWRADNSFAFYIDDALISTPAFAQTVSTNMNIILSDLDAGGLSLTVNSISCGAYPTSGSFTSRIFDQGSNNTWGLAEWNISEPSGTAIAIEARTGNSSTPDGSWTAYVPLVNVEPSGLSGQYLQYRATLSTSNPVISPVLEDL